MPKAIHRPPNDPFQHRNARVTTAQELEEICKMGCSDTGCLTPPEQHELIYITSQCHPDSNAVFAFYDRITNEIAFECRACRKGIIKVKVL